MTTAPHPYHGVAVAIATLHGKAEALAPAFAAVGIRLVEAVGVDTDALGTFTGEVPRTMPPLETAIAKARLGMRRTGLPVGIATEGSFGPDPVIGLLPLHREHIVLVDDVRGIVVSDVIATHATNFDGKTFPAGEYPTADDVARWQLPSHAVIVRADPLAEGVPVHKGLRDLEAVLRAMDLAWAASPTGRARVETDMRAHLNPTRMTQIGVLGERLVQRLAYRCPGCNAPGFGLVDRRPGLPCADCGLPTSQARAEVHGCPACGKLEERPRRDGVTTADPAHCDACNP